MNKIGTVFQFAAPDGWNELQESSRYVFHGPNREEMILSASLIEGSGESSALAAAQQGLFQIVEQSVKNAAANPALRITLPFQRIAHRSQLECWSLHAQTHDGNVLFYQGVCRGFEGVL